MSATHHTRIQRLQRLEALLPKPGTAPAHCLEGVRLMAILGEAYGQGTATARRRALQRDLETLVKEERIEAVNPGGKPLRYRRTGDPIEDDALIWEYTLRQVQDLIADAIPQRQFDRIWQRLLHEFDQPLLSPQQLRVLPDTLRLRPVELYPAVLQAVISALAQQRALEVTYRNAEGDRSRPLLHPQALVQRGPIPYLIALKNDETQLRLYALHRFIRAEVDPSTPARSAEGFDLDQAIAEGLIDFGQGRLIDLTIRVRGYLTALLQTCPLTDEQRTDEEPDDSAFDLCVNAHLPQTGQLLRWLLGAGDNLEVVAPAELRHVLIEQARKMSVVYLER